MTIWLHLSDLCTAPTQKSNLSVSGVTQEGTGFGGPSSGKVTFETNRFERLPSDADREHDRTPRHSFGTRPNVSRWFTLMWNRGSARNTGSGPFRGSRPSSPGPSAAWGRPVPRRGRSARLQRRSRSRKGGLVALEISIQPKDSIYRGPLLPDSKRSHLTVSVVEAGLKESRTGNTRLSGIWLCSRCWTTLPLDRAIWTRVHLRRDWTGQ